MAFNLRLCFLALTVFAGSNVIAKEVSEERAFQLLLQSTFGPTQYEIKQVQELGVEGWIEAQIQAPNAYERINSETNPSQEYNPSMSHVELTADIAQTLYPDIFSKKDAIFNHQKSGLVLNSQMSAFLHSSIGLASQYPEVGKDQLRQRVAYALSQLLVVSHVEPPLFNRAEALAYYFDILAKNAFGNYRELLSEVSYSPAMGVFLSYRGNRKYNPKNGRHPDENYARELMQLFTLGVYQRNIDGTPNYDGDPYSLKDKVTELVPSYTQKDVEELAKVLTGWEIAGQPFGKMRHQIADYTRPMVNTQRFHEDEQAEAGDGLVHLLGETINLRKGSAVSHLEQALDIIFKQPNLAPHVSRHLIMQLVTSNPSNSYIERVAKVFNDNGQSERGDLGAVIKAILLDPEAKQPTPKVKEPFMAYIQLLRALNVQGDETDHIYKLPSAKNKLGHAPLRSESVFNFYDPEYVPNKDYFQEQQLFSPELEIINRSQLIEFNNQILRTIFFCDAFDNGKKTPDCFGLHYNSQDIIREISLDAVANNKQDIASLLETRYLTRDELTQLYPTVIDTLAKKLLGRPLSYAQQAQILAFLKTKKPQGKKVYDMDTMVKYSVYLIATSPMYRVQG